MDLSHIVKCTNIIACESLDAFLAINYVAATTSSESLSILESILISNKRNKFLGYDPFT
ncbi:18227_t:CDS:2 [Gigaspora margarita]|uniref:18227_t:CDS:1 n=1 Tax=Gigaspora margarita TaxID=4874 RepID=A0ABM8VVP3_GIGMA|nr:18227_t:CDS:2 [Gigaspora margarita]